MYLILHPILHNFIQLPLLPKYKKNPELYYNDLINLAIRLSQLSTGQLAKCEREKWEELSQEYLDLDEYQSNIYYDTWSTIAKLVVQNKNAALMEEETKKSNKSLAGDSSSNLLNNSSSKSKSKLKSKKSSLSSSSSLESFINMNETIVEFDRSNYIWGWPFFLTFLFYQLIEVKKESNNEVEDLYIEINDNLDNPHFDYNDNLNFWARNITKYLFLMNILQDKSSGDSIKDRIFDENDQLIQSYEQKMGSFAVSTTNCKLIDLVFLRVKESKNSIVYNGSKSNDQNEDDPVDYSKYGKLEPFMSNYITSIASLAMIQNITKAKGKSVDYLKIKEIQKWLIDKLLETTQNLNNLYDKLDPFKPTPLISLKLLPTVELVCSEGGVVRGTYPPAFYMKESTKNNVNRHVILRNQTKKFIYIPPEYIENTHLHLQNLHHCEIYILTSVKSITLTNSHHCKCIFGCVASRLTLNTVQNIKFSACTEQATFERCQDITAYLYIKKPSLVIGKCIHSLFVAPINSWYKDVNKQIKQAQIQLSNGQKNNWNCLRLVWFDKNNFDLAVNEQYETKTTNTDTNTMKKDEKESEEKESEKKESEEKEINIYHKLDKVLNLKGSDEHLQEKIQKIFLLPSEFYELFVIPIFNKKKKSNSQLNLKTYSIDNLDNLDYDENYQHSSSIMAMVPSSKSMSNLNKTGKKINEEKSRERTAKKENDHEFPSIDPNDDEEYDEGSKDSVYSRNILNKLPKEYYKSVMNKHESHCIAHRILSDKNLIYQDKDPKKIGDNCHNNNDYNNDFNEETTEKENNNKETEEDVNSLIRNDFYKWLRDTNNIEQVQRLLNYRKDSS